MDDVVVWSFSTVIQSDSRSRLSLAFLGGTLVDSTIPESAAQLLDLIGKTEAPKGYDTIFGNHQRELKQPLTTMTLDQVITSGPHWTKAYGSSACGRYQFMTATLKQLRISENLTGREIFAGDLQDRLGYALLDGCGYERFLTGKLSLIGFGLALAKEWASFPVLADCRGSRQRVRRGDTYYAGDGRNKALIKPGDVEKILEALPKEIAHAAIKALFGVEAAPKPKPARRNTDTRGKVRGRNPSKEK